MSPVNVGAIGAYIREQREQAKISLRQLAQSAGISNPYLSQIERGLRRPSADILQQIAKGLRISAEALYVQAGFLEDRPPGSVVREAVLTDEELTERQKQMLIEVYESFRKETAMARADTGELVDDQTGLTPDEGALGWPEDLSPAALASRPRRLAIAPYADDADGDGTDGLDSGGEGDEGEEGAGGGYDDADELGAFRHDRVLRGMTAGTGWPQAAADASPDDDASPEDEAADSGPAEAGWPSPDPDESGPSESPQGGTIHQFPPPAGTR